MEHIKSCTKYHSGLKSDAIITVLDTPMLTINPAILRTPVADKGILLLEPTTGKYFELNETSALIYQQLEQGSDIQSIVKTLITAFDIDTQTALSDINEIIVQFIQNNICVEA